VEFSQFLIDRSGYERAGFSSTYDRHRPRTPQALVDALVTCSQSLHWMEPEPTFAEVARILRRGGVFAAYDYDWPTSSSGSRCASWAIAPSRS
jgi:SAM-dependent methyltransferase